MLSRIAESLYWIGRYIERAEDTARLLDVHYHLLLEDRRADESGGVPRAARRDGRRRRARSAASPNAATVTALLAQDLTFSGSITCSIGAAWENARGAREAMSSELWETLEHDVPRGRQPGARGHRPARVTSSSAGCATARPRATGIVDATMSRDDGWRFFSVGRSLERADMTDAPAARPLRRRVRAHRAGPRRCAAARRTRRTCARTATRSTPPTAVEFLLLDRLFPRSVFHALTTADNSLGELDPRAARAGVDDEARRRLGSRAAPSSSSCASTRRWTTCPQLLARLQHECADVHAAIARRYFRETRVIEWSV